MACIRQTLARLAGPDSADAAGIRTRRRARARAAADAPVRPRDRLASRRYPDHPAQDSRGRRLPRRAGRHRGRAVSISTTRIAKGACAATPGAIVATRGGAICRATRDGAVWIGHFGAPTTRSRSSSRAAMVLGDRVAGVPESPLTPEEAVDYPTWQPIRYVEAGRSAICISRSTTAPWARSSARRCAARMPMRARGRRASSRSWAARISGPTGSTST